MGRSAGTDETGQGGEGAPRPGAVTEDLGRAPTAVGLSPDPTLPSGPPAAMRELPPGTTLGGYVILGRLGGGGMGVVYTAHDPELDRKVALKLLRGDEAGARNATLGRERLLREAQAMAKLAHENVIAVHDVGTVDGQVFIAMELVEGRTLRLWLDEQPRSVREVLRVFVQAGRGLAAAHAAGLIHRDFKPDNVLVARDGRVRVVDFGLARAAAQPPEPATSADGPGARDGSAAGAGPASTTGGQGPGGSLPPGSLGSGKLATPLTRAGAILGTPGYMAPEQLLGRPTDARSDQFSFAVALWDEGRIPTALQHSNEALAIAEEQLGPDHPTVGVFLNGKAGVLVQFGRDDEALAIYRRALAIKEAALGPHHPDVGGGLYNVGLQLHKSGQQNEALDHFRRALAVWEKAHGPHHPDLAHPLGTIGEVLTRQRKFDEAQRHFERALAIRQKAQGPEHPDAATLVTNLGDLAQARGRLDEAAAHHARATAIREKSQGAKHPDVAYPLTDQGRVEIARRAPARAVPPLERALAIRDAQECPPAEHAKTRFLLAQALIATGGDRARARGLAEQARDSYAKAVGPESAKALAEVRGWLARHGWAAATRPASAAAAAGTRR